MLNHYSRLRKWGVYLAAEQYAKENNIAWGVHLPEYQKYGRGAPENIPLTLMANSCIKTDQRTLEMKRKGIILAGVRVPVSNL